MAEFRAGDTSWKSGGHYDTPEAWYEGYGIDFLKKTLDLLKLGITVDEDGYPLIITPERPLRKAPSWIRNLYEKNSSFEKGKYGVEKFYMPHLPARVLSDEERADFQTLIHKEISEAAKTKIEELVELCQLLTIPENHIKVPSGVYKEVAVNVSTTAEMVNQAVQTLTDLPRFTAAAKIISEEHDKQTVWKGQIETKELEDPVNGLDVQERIIERTRELCCRPRHEIEQEIASRRSQWRNTGGRRDTPSRKPTSRSTSRKTPPPSWG